MRRNKDLETLKRNFDDSQQTAAEDVDKRHQALQRHIDATASELANLRRSCDEQKKEASIFTIGGVKKECNESIAEITSRLEKKREDIFLINKSSQMSQITKEYQNHIALLNDDTNKGISKLDTEINALQSKISRITSTREKDIEKQLLPLQQNILSAEANYAKQAAKNEAERDAMLKRLGSNQNVMDTLDAELTELRDQRTKIREIINAKANGNQIYRMAMMYTGKDSAADVGRDEAALVAVIWFGSLAAVVAFTGILLALASYMLRKDYFNETPREIVQTGKVLRSIRSFFVARRRVITRPRIEKVFVDREVPKEVIKEVPVEKVSIKEVPVEVIRKEIVHVPMYTNDENLLKKV